MANENRKTSFKKALTFVDLSRIPGPRGKKFFSYVKSFQKDILGSFTQVYKDYGSISSFPWPMNSVIIYSPEFVKKVLVDDAKKFEKGEQIEELKAVVGNGLATNNNHDTWLRSRSIVSREFGNKAVDNSSMIILKIIEEHLSKYKDGEIDICHEMKRLTFEIACKIFLGLEADNSDAKLVSEAVEFTSLVTYERIFLLIPLPYWVPTKKHREFNKHYRNLDRIVSKVIENASSGLSRPCVLTRLVGAEDPETKTKLNRAELRDEILTIMLAGHETSAHSLTWTFTLISQHPEIQQKLFEEINALDLTQVQNIIDKTPYLQLVLNESMRLYPAFPILSRKTKEEARLGEHVIPAKTNVVIPIYVMQRSEEFWDNPLEFMPERFLKEENRKSYAFLPFSRGQRRCVGEIFAMTEMSLIVIQILKVFRLELIGSFPEDVAAVSLKPKEKFTLRLRRR